MGLHEPSGTGPRETTDWQNRLTAQLEELRKICNRVQYQTAVAQDGLPIPPPEMHAEVSGTDGLDVALFLEIGRGCAGLIATLLERQHVTLERLQSVLDFGCGCGRIMRHFHKLRGPRLYGTDYNPWLVDWCQRNLPFAEFGVNGLHPPLTYESGTFDLVYTFSVFTHLSEPLQSSWLAELRRVLRPDGHLLMTTHGQAYADLHLNPQEREQFRAGRMVVREHGSPGDNSYGAFHPPSYVHEMLEGFELKEFVPGQVFDLNRRIIGQDSFLLRKRS
jgi:SAM-dependent methyltransferase